MTTLRRRTNSEREIEPRTAICEEYSSSRESFNNLTCMAFRDRTSEFLSVVRSKEVRIKDNGYIQKGRNAAHGKLAEWRNFMEVAKDIGKDIAKTFTKLEKLTLLAKKKSLFDDRQEIEIHELTYIVKQDLQNLNKQIAHLQEMSKSKSLYPSQNKVLKSHSNSVVISLQGKLAAISNDFKDVLEVRTENLKHQKNRREQFTNCPVGRERSLPSSALSGSVLLTDNAQKNSINSDVAINMDNMKFLPQQQLQLIDQQDSYIQSRADTMGEIEATIVELGSIFQQLAHMVKEQDEMVQRIDSNVEDAYFNIEAAHSQILKYFQNVTSNRWLMIKVFAVLIIFFIIFVVFVA